MTNPSPSYEPVSLYVDLDGTLIHSDLLLESVLALLRRNPLYLFLLPWWLRRGKAHLKHQIAQRVDLDPVNLPYNIPLLEFLKSEQRRGRRLVLATASHRSFAERVAQHLGVFAAVLATDAARNVSGPEKLDAIRDDCGDAPFDYAGNEARDLAIWREARGAIVVNASDRVLETTKQITEVRQVFDKPEAGPMVYLRALRLHQWLKNVLLFVPLLTAHQWANPAAIGHLLLAFVAFGLGASGIYVLNDLLDLNADRTHPRKRLRPFAAGAAPLLHGMILAPLLLVAAVIVALLLPADFMRVLLAYLAIAVSYSAYLKRLALVDVLSLAGLYTLRVIAGATAIGVPLSFWLLAFSVFMFFSIALAKRCAELGVLQQRRQDAAAGRDYRVSDLGYLRSMGIASGYLAVLVFALFINSPDVAERYAHPQLLWLSCPALLYWISRLWIKEGRGEMHDDPLIYTLRDPASYLVLATMVTTVLLAV